MPKVLNEEQREAVAIVLLDFAKGKYPEYTDAQLSSVFKRASSKVRKVRMKVTVIENS